MDVAETPTVKTISTMAITNRRNVRLTAVLLKVRRRVGTMWRLEMQNTKMSDFEIYLIDIIRSSCIGYCTHCVHYSPETLCKKRANRDSILEVPQEVCREGILRFFEEKINKDCGTKQQKTEVKVRENELHEPKIETLHSYKHTCILTYCNVCGNPLMDTDWQLKCEKDLLAVVISNTQNYCPNCGARLKEVDV